MSIGCSYQVMLSTNFEESTQLVTDALKDEGFGVITEIDVQSILKTKLGERFRPYIILGACNPSLARQALLNEPEVGVMLPCNVTLDQQEEGVLVSFANPEVMLSVGEFKNNPQLREVAALVNARIMRVVQSLH